MKKIIFFSLLLINFLIVNPNSAQACSCIMPAPPLESMDQSAAVFSGKVLGVNQTGMNLNVALEVSQVWKGNLSKETNLVTAQDSAACGYYFEEGKEYLVYAYETEEGELGTGLCSRTALLVDAQVDVTALGEGKAPVENPSPSAIATFNPTIIAIAAGVVVILGGLLVFKRRK